MAKNSIAYEDWRAEIDRLYPVPTDEGMTAAEIADASNRSEATVRRMLRIGVASGKYVRGVSLRPRLDGAMMPVAVYSVVKQKGRKK